MTELGGVSALLTLALLLLLAAAAVHAYVERRRRIRRTAVDMLVVPPLVFAATRRISRHVLAEASRHVERYIVETAVREARAEAERAMRAEYPPELGPHGPITTHVDAHTEQLTGAHVITVRLVVDEARWAS